MLDLKCWLLHLFLLVLIVVGDIITCTIRPSFMTGHVRVKLEVFTADVVADQALNRGIVFDI